MLIRRCLFSLLLLLSLLGQAAPTPAAVHVLPAWASFFKREAGWQYGDAAYSALIPQHHRLWLFGDSIITGWPRFARNAIAYQSRVRKNHSPLAQDFQFFARDSRGQIINVTQNGSAFGREWFRSSTEDLLDTNPHKTWQWPTGILAFHHKIILFYTEYRCTKGNIANGCEGPWNFAETHQYIGIIQNSSELPNKWILQQKVLGSGTVLSGINWGSGLLKEGKNILIFGRDKDGRLKVAKSTMPNIMNFSHWYFLTQQGWRQRLPTSASQLRTLTSGVPTEYTIHRYSAHGRDIFYLIQGQPFINNQVVVRGSTSWQQWPSIAGQSSTPALLRINLNKLDPIGSDPQHLVYAIKGQSDMVSWPNFIISYFSTKTNSIRFLQLTMPMISLW